MKYILGLLVLTFAAGISNAQATSECRADACMSACAVKRTAERCMQACYDEERRCTVFGSRADARQKIIRGGIDSGLDRWRYGAPSAAGRRSGDVR
jgi:hypothetical protein